MLKAKGTGKETTLSIKIETDKFILVQCIEFQMYLRSLQFCVSACEQTSFDEFFDISCTANRITIIVRLLSSTKGTHNSLFQGQQGSLV